MIGQLVITLGRPAKLTRPAPVLLRLAQLVPGQFGVVGCDDVLGAATYPSLTTVSNRSVEAGKAALSLLLELLQSQSLRDIRYVLDTHLVIRNTTIGHKE